MQSEPAPLDRIRIPRDQVMSNYNLGDGTPQRHHGSRGDHGGIG
jgi:hypothetical protein